MNDISVIPNESTQFGFCDRFGREVKMEEMPLYKEDRLGLRKMKEDGKLKLLDAPLEHLELDHKWFRENVIPILKEI